MKFRTLLIVFQLLLGAVMGLIAAALALWTDCAGLAAVLTAGSSTLVVFGLITATSIGMLRTAAGPVHGD